MNRIIACSGAMLLCCTVSVPALDKMVDFDNHSAGKYTENMASGDFSTNTWNNGLDEGRATIVDGGEAYSGKSLRITYKGNAYGPSDGGVQFGYTFGKSDEMNLEYRLKFASGFEFVKGGKLPGLCGGNCPSGGEDANNGWSARYMWRVRTIGGQDRTLGEVYLYHPDKPGDYGDDIYFDNRQFEFQSGRWYQLRQYIKMNTPGEYDGVLRVWVDGEQVISKTGLRFRLSGDVGIDHLSFTTFFGGGDGSWAPSSDQHAYFDDIHVYSGGGSGGTTNPGGNTEPFVLEDFGDLQNRTLMGGIWYDFNDNNNLGASTIAFAPTAGGYDGGQSAKATYTLDQGEYAYDPFVGLGAYIKEDKTAFDLSPSTGISFWYKGGSDNMVLRVETNEVAATEKKAYHRVSIPRADSWTLFEASWDEFVQPSWSGVVPTDLNLAGVIKLSWQIKGDRNATSPESGEFWLDEVTILGMAAPAATAMRPAITVPAAEATAFLRRNGSRVELVLPRASSSRVSARLYNAAGRPLDRAFTTTVDNRLVLDTRDLARGAYFVRVWNGSRKQAIPFCHSSE